MAMTSLMLAPLLLTSLAGSPPPSRNHLADQLHALLAGKTLAPVASVGALPPAVRSELARLFQEPELVMADPEQPFQVTDVVITPNLPGRRLRFAGKSGDLVVVHYEEGGFAHSYMLVVFRSSPTGTHAVWSASTKGPIPRLDDLKDAGQYVVDVVSRH
jgi:hypothetical protein